ncbi:hypothetical protein EKO23_19540 [Nocardioides guangzhouensis]|uniref:Histidine phosphatase family protein n=1 Tax=Nocardioides guangzhouensis TaxID=2497878 RepID=A0A4V1XYH4_9ACTN|nr:hypothetical protein [Nocardioides guangzhouensis]RYP83259.1 hypothetical protein EKO23_19540 [Nocardioides guangzhouensis]
MTADADPHPAETSAHARWPVDDPCRTAASRLLPVRPARGQPTRSPLARSDAVWSTVNVTRYVLLCRHGSHRSGVLTPVNKESPDDYPIDGVASRLREELARENPPGRTPIRIHRAAYADTPESRHTLEKLAKGIGHEVGLHDGDEGAIIRTEDGQTIKVAPSPDLMPSQDQSSEDVTRAAENWTKAASEANGNAVLLVGHQPALGRICDALLSREPGWEERLRLRPRPSTPIDRSGIVCVAVDDGGPRKRARAWVAWAISYDDSAAADAVRAKVGRKMDVAKTLAGVVTLGLPLVLGVLFDSSQFDGLGDRRWAVQAGALCYLVAGALFLATMFYYDSLLMPERFWGETAAGARKKQPQRRWLVERPPSSAAWVLYQNMMRIWRRLFTVGAVVAFLGSAFMAYGAIRVSLGTTMLVGVPGALLTAWLVNSSSPLLGSED